MRTGVSKLNQEILTGNLKKQFLKYLIPAISGNLTYGLLIFIDSVFIGRGVGPLGLSALNISLPIFTLVSFGMMIGIGGATAAGIDLGKRNFESRNKIFTYSIIMGVLISLSFSLLLVLNLDKVSILLGANKEIFGLVKSYIGVISWSILFYIMPHILTNFIRNDNNPKLAMYYLFICSVLNIVLDYIFIFPLNMGMAGAAIATSIAQGVGTLFLLTHFLTKNNTLYLKKVYLDFSIIMRIIKIGASTFINEICIGIVVIISNYQFFKYLGNNGIAAYAIILNLKLLIYLTLSAFGQGMQPLISINYGGKNYQRVIATFKMATYSIIALSIIFYLILISNIEYFVGMFNKDNLEIIKIAKIGFPLFYCSLIFTGINIQFCSFFQSIEHGKIASIINFGRGVVIISILLYVLPMIFGVTGLWISYLINEVLTTGYIIFYYKKRFSLN